ncbi:MAG: endonuclease [Bacteroidetes bacterium]|nr:MAG: endonuclease [Bacteroidota bacterium]
MADHNKLGEEGESIALEYLKDKGYKILETNWRSGREEIDIIAELDETLIIVEVKTRQNDYSGSPEQFVNNQKQRRLIKATSNYIDETNFNGETRFDVISIIIGAGQPEINHICDAYYVKV